MRVNLAQLINAPFPPGTVVQPLKDNYPSGFYMKNVDGSWASTAMPGVRIEKFSSSTSSYKEFIVQYIPDERAILIERLDNDGYT